MERLAKDWAVVVLGRWNPAILTPAGIATRLLGLNKDAPIEVQVALNEHRPFRVRSDGLIISVDWSALRIELEDPTFPKLATAMALATKAIKSLPETPLIAAGINVKYEVNNPTATVLKLLDSGFVTAMSDAGRQVKERSYRLTLLDDPGVINFELAYKSTEVLVVSSNFHCESTEEATLANWCSQAIDNLEQTVHSIVGGALGITAEEELDGTEQQNDE